MSADDMCPNCVTPWKCNGPHHRDESAPINYARFGACVAGAMDTYLTSDAGETPGELVSYLLDLAERAGIRPGSDS